MNEQIAEASAFLKKDAFPLIDLGNQNVICFYIEQSIVYSDTRNQTGVSYKQ